MTLWSPESLEAALHQQFPDQAEFSWACAWLRAALTGSAHSISVFKIMSVIGPEDTRARVCAALEILDEKIN